MKKIHFIGIKGVGMTALAILAKEKGYQVTGADVADTFLTDPVLTKFKIPVETGFLPRLKYKPDLIVVTGAHGGLNNPQAVFYAGQGVEVITHGQALGRFMNDKFGISVAGVGGKSTTSAIIATILTENKLSPSYAVGVADIFPLGQPGHFGKGKYFVAEADEYVSCPGVDLTPRFLYQHPKVIVITNIEYDHPDVYRSLSETMSAFDSFVKNLPSDGVLIINDDNPNNHVIKKTAGCQVFSYGFSGGVDYQIGRVRYREGVTYFSLHQGNLSLGEYQIKAPGKFNVANATAAISVGLNLGLNTLQVQKGLAAFLGTKRRFELIGEKNGIKVYDDYAHHPSEIKMTLMAIKDWYPDYKVIVIFQPHTYSRTKTLLNDFAQSFGFADEVVILPIFASAREEDDPSINSSILTGKINYFHPHASFIADEREILDKVSKIKGKAIIVTMGAGNVYELAPKILNNISA